MKHLLLNEELECFKNLTSKNRNKLIIRNQGFVWKVAKHYYKPNNHYSLDDLYMQGNIGLIDAIDRYDIKKNVKFITFAVWYIQNEIISYIRSFHTIFKLPNYSQKLDISVVRLDVGENENLVNHELIEDENSTKNNNENVAHVLSDIILNKCPLSKKEKEIFISRNREGMTLEEISWEHNISKERIRQIYNKAEKKLSRWLTNLMS